MFTNIKDMFTNSCEQLLKLLDLVPRQVLENELSTSPRDILLLGVSRHDGPSRAPQRLEAMDLVPNSFGEEFRTDRLPEFVHQKTKHVFTWPKIDSAN